MVLMKILSGNVAVGQKAQFQESSIQSIFQNHMVVENWGPDMEVLRRMADAFQKRDLHMLRAVLQEISFETTRRDLHGRSRLSSRTRLFSSICGF